MIGNGRKLRVVEYPWSGLGKIFKLLESLILKLRSSGISTLNKACLISFQRETIWKNSKVLGLEEGLKEEWEEYVSLLKSCFIHLEEEKEDKLVWTKNIVNGDFSTKLGYKTWAWEHHQGEKREWWNKLWKEEGKLNAKLNLRFSLNNKLLTWDNLQK